MGAWRCGGAMRALKMMSVTRWRSSFIIDLNIRWPSRLYSIFGSVCAPGLGAPLERTLEAIADRYELACASP